MIRVKSVEVRGSTIYRPEQFDQITGSLAGHAVNLQTIFDAAGRLTAKYGDDGYVFSRVIVPPQSLDPDGAQIVLQVVEGYVDKVEWPADLGSAYKSLFDAYSAKITAKRPTNIKTVERYLLLANDLPGVTVRSKFQASTDNSGATTLKVETDYKPYGVEGRLDNRGTTGRGPWQYLTSVEGNNLLGMRERLGFTYAGAFQSDELRYFAGSINVVLNEEGLTSFSGLSYSNGDPGIFELRQLGYGGQSFNFETGLSYPLIRSRDENFVLSGSFFVEDAKGDTDTQLISRDRIRGIRLKADYDLADELGGISQIRLTFSQGIAGLGATENGNPYASRSSGRVDFSSLELYLSRVQHLGHGFSLFGALDASYAFNPLLAAEECSYGGRFIGRGFDPSELTGDRCVIALAEARYDLPVNSQTISSAQLYNFVDFGTVHRIEPAAGEGRNDEGASAGVGLRANLMNHLNVDVSAAKPIEGRDDDDWRFFLALNTRF
ncbi:MULTISPECIES: ShlB/FhaC/HecB family hemolysin secretion/activation protein [unclassified Mesorhizobium]|uniref:ShlB/FhaC/HecB family hemolysin secretion/activation protein n=1 Tax=unclassified Mesorhizobium TaxID=325217 RepID=UPI0015E2C36A|nr:MULTISPECIES: ShlB/FhaC/HecB family hemolysin secretion/activation protein [unclassified Mesorhizobium]